MSEHGTTGNGKERPRRQFVRYTFFKVAPEWRRLSPREQDEQRAEFQRVIEAWAEKNLVYCYSTMGTRGDTDFMIWQISYDLEDLQRMAGELMGTAFAGWLTTPYAYLSMTKHSTYVGRQPEPGQPGPRVVIRPREHKYLFVYPMTKVRPWYRLPKEERQQAMNEHIAIGHTYPTVKLNTTYSFGLDDQEFMVSFETDNPADFLDLVQELRPSSASAYTQFDVPVFTCIQMTAGDMLGSLGIRAEAAVGSR